MTYWSVPRAFPDSTMVVMASGPSMNADVAAAVRASGLPTIVVKWTFRLAPWAWLLYGAERKFWRNPEPRHFPGLMVAVEPVPEAPEVLLLRNTGVDGFDTDPSCLRTGNNSGYQAVHLAIHAGAARVLLVGFDMKGGRWHGRRDGPVRRDWIERFAALGEHAEIINCTHGSALKCFRFMGQYEALIAYGNPAPRLRRTSEAAA